MQQASLVAIGNIMSLVRAKRIEAGERLPSERDLAERFDMSRGVIREALATLEVMRFIERRPNSGIYLRDTEVEGSFEALVLQAHLGLPIKTSEIVQALELRRIMEVQATRLACERATAKDLRAIRAILEEADKRIAEGKTIEAEDQSFHLAIVAATKNDVFLRVVNAFYEVSRPRRKVNFQNVEKSALSSRDHYKVYEALEKGDADAAAEAMERHLLSAAAHWKELLAANPRQLKQLVQETTDEH
ncbi:FadR/GntR family transcriptional regulator [Ancylobacter polymorphus]|uniref:FadR family transcriptional regulator n=1 Tax=Ancylobacter polymorphus TaxID=223390 RepID=A0A9E7A2A3_9HYPH|nr:FadR/GntR family transcriptional regulator [Ancylobacter polymorphus]UOK71875.1 FadR family transcriptional regulator [Ancylobacter polymorphus]